MCKKIISLLLCCLLITSSLPVGAFAHTDSTEQTLPSWESLSATFQDTAPVSAEATLTAEQESFLSGAATADVGDHVYYEKESNNSASSANILYDDYTVNASISRSDRIDYYTFRLYSTTTVMFVCVADYRSLMIGILDAYGETIAVGTDNGLTSGGNYSDVLVCTLPAGQYYMAALDVSDYPSYCAYTFYFTMSGGGSHSHSYSQTVVAPTCQAGGYTYYYCSCGEYYYDNYTDATDHSWGQWTTVVPPTSTTLGYNSRYCTVCGISEQQNTPFADIFESDYYCAPVLWAVSRGITTGTSATTFSPNDTCTRGQIVTFLWRTCGSPEPMSSISPFRDIYPGDYYYKAVLWAVANGITSGMGDGTFAPNAPCTRGQVATFLWRSQGKPAAHGSNIFVDVSRGAYYHDAVLWAVANGITNGMGNGTFAPESPCTRGQIVTFLYRALA